LRFSAGTVGAETVFAGKGTAATPAFAIDTAAMQPAMSEMALTNWSSADMWMLISQLICLPPDFWYNRKSLVG
jgi:hypothetical protein